MTTRATSRQTTRNKTINPHPQLPLPVTLDERATFDNFTVGGNAEVIAGLTSASPAPFTWLCGARGVGKSHLLQALCASATNGAYLTGAVVASWPADGLAGFE
ncbi:MAG: hypothetical protein AAFU65_17860, partial [Pseudomonadota bacterium]